MQISFTQDELKDALLEALEKQISLQPGQNTTIEFDLSDPKNIIAYIDITRDKGTSSATTTAAPAKTYNKPGPKPGSTRKTAVKEEVPETDPVAEAITTSDQESQVEATNEVQELDTPFDTSAGSVAEASNPGTASISTGEERVNPDDISETAAASPKSSIFPNSASSAAPASPVPSAAGAKSLFANLVKPNNDKTATTH